MFMLAYDKKKVNKDLLITYHDYMIKSLDFIEYWETKGVNEEATLFLIRTIYRLIENAIPDEEASSSE